MRKIETYEEYLIVKSFVTNIEKNSKSSNLEETELKKIKKTSKYVQYKNKYDHHKKLVEEYELSTLPSVNQNLNKVSSQVKDILNKGNVNTQHEQIMHLITDVGSKLY